MAYPERLRNVLGNDHVGQGFAARYGGFKGHSGFKQSGQQQAGVVASGQVGNQRLLGFWKGAQHAGERFVDRVCRVVAAKRFGWNLGGRPIRLDGKFAVTRESRNGRRVELPNIAE